jgi:phosphoribosylglycinamide formyltransferase-1
MLRIGVLASHQGTNFQAVADACAAGEINASVVMLICNNSTAAVMQRAERTGIPSKHLSSRTHPDPDELDAIMCEVLTESGAELIVLAGYMKKLGPKVLSHYEDRIINVHPSLLPRYGGKGFYGAHVHEAVLAAGDRVTGATVHLVNGEYDKGDIVLQEELEVRRDDTSQSLAERVHHLEHRLLLEAISQFTQSGREEN